MLSPPSSKKLSSTPTRSSPSTSANRPHSTSSCGRARRRGRSRRRQLRRGQGPPVHLAVRRQRQRARAPRTPPAPCTPAALAPTCAAQLAGVRLPASARRHHVGDQPLARRARPRAPPPPPARRRVRQQRRLDLAQLDPEAAHLHLVVGAAEELQLAVRPPAHQVAGAVHPRARPARTGRPRTARRSARAGPGSRGPDPRPPMYSSPGTPSRHRPQPRVEHVAPACCRSAGRSARVAAHPTRATSMPGRERRGLGRAVDVEQASAGPAAQRLPPPVAAIERLAADRADPRRSRSMPAPRLHHAIEQRGSGTITSIRRRHAARQPARRRARGSALDDHQRRAVQQRAARSRTSTRRSESRRPARTRSSRRRCRRSRLLAATRLHHAAVRDRHALGPCRSSRRCR